MSSAHRINLISDLTLEARTVSGGEGQEDLIQGWAVNHPDLVDKDGNPVVEVRLTPGNVSDDPLEGKAYSKTIALSPKYNEYVLVATCKGCVLSVTLQYSPDGINWCDCVLNDGLPCTVDCDPTVADCTVKIIDVPMLQYVRVVVQSAGDATLDCDIYLTHTMNY